MLIQVFTKSEMLPLTDRVKTTLPKKDRRRYGRQIIAINQRKQLRRFEITGIRIRTLQDIIKTYNQS